jgi:hypothetical protein
VAAIAVALTSPVIASTDLFAVAPSTVYQSIQKQSLSTALAQVAQRTGIVFKINTDIGSDVVSKTLVANDWTTAIKSLLVNYNYTIVTDKGVVKTVIITGHAGNGSDPVQVTSSVEPTDYNAPIILSQKMGDLPSKYNGFPSGSVLPISFPVKELMSLGKGEKALLDTPLGQFNVAHDSTAQELGGSQTWVGHLSDEGLGYRMMISQGPAGIMGHISTPEGTFNIETTNGSMYLVDTSKLDHVGFEGDTVEPAVVADTLKQMPLTAGANVAVKATVTEVAAFKAAMDSAKAVSLLDASAVLTAQTAQTAAQTAQTTALANSTKLRATATTLALNTTKALMAWYNSPSRPYSMLMDYMKACNIAVAADNTAKAASAVLVTATANLTAANTALSTAKAKAALSLTAYNTALAAYNVAAATVVVPPVVVVTPTPQNANTVVDIMVLYTAHTTNMNDPSMVGKSAGYTADYAKQRIAYLVTASNQSYIDSGVKLAIRLVYAEPTTYTDTNSLNVALADLALGNGVFSGVAAKRTQVGADLVYLFRPLNAVTNGACGLAYMQLANGGPTIKELGFGVVSDGYSQDSRQGAFCRVNTFTHEIGHGMGLVHDREYSTTYQGAFPYSYAWGVVNAMDQTKAFGTIMSYKGPAMIMLFSSPALTTQCAGGPCGFAETDLARSSDQVKSLNLSVSKIAGLYPTLTTAPVIK